jgi:hypothetical protein
MLNIDDRLKTGLGIISRANINGIIAFSASQGTRIMPGPGGSTFGIL